MIEDTSPIPMQQCAACGNYKPEHSEFFPRSESRDRDYMEICLTCRQRKDEKKHEEEILARLAKLRGNSLKVLDAMSTQSTDVPHIAEVYQRFMEICGGAPGFAKEVFLHLVSSKPGSMTKQRALDSILKLANNVSESGAAKKSMDQYTDEDLEREIESATRQVLLMQPIVDEAEEGLLDGRAG